VTAIETFNADVSVLVTKLPRTGIGTGLAASIDADFRTVAEQTVVAIAI
jgi:hypothetical protein